MSVTMEILIGLVRVGEHKQAEKKNLVLFSFHSAHFHIKDTVYFQRYDDIHDLFAQNVLDMKLEDPLYSLYLTNYTESPDFCGWEHALDSHLCC